jgi:hypothetical protein
MPNRTSGSTLPGLCIAQDVSHFNSTAGWVKSLDEANRAKEAMQQQPPTAPTQAEAPGVSASEPPKAS